MKEKQTTRSVLSNDKVMKLGIFLNTLDTEKYQTLQQIADYVEERIGFSVTTRQVESAMAGLSKRLAGKEVSGSRNNNTRTLARYMIYLAEKLGEQEIPDEVRRVAASHHV